MAELNEAESTKDAKKTKKEKKMEEKAAKKAAKKAKKNHEADKPDAENDDSDSVSSKIVMVLVTILIIAIWLGIFAVFVKADVGGFGSTVLAPALKDVPVLSKILPDSGNITASESKETAGYTNLDDAVSRIKELEKQLDDANSKNQADAQTINDLNAQIQDLSTYKEDQAAFEEEKEKYYEEVVFSDKAPDIKEYKKFYEQVDPANAEILYKQVCEQLEQDDEIKDYAKTYSKMKPKEAAAIFDSMTDNLSLVAKILNAMDAQSRGNILGKMDSATAAKVTKIMNPSQDGTNINGEIGELHLSAISEAMNQMMGSSATSLSSMLNRTIDISPPIAEVVDLKNTLNEGEIDSFLSEEFVKISFRMEIGDLVDSEIMQLYPPAFVKEMCKGVSQNMELDTQSVTEDVPQSSNTATQAAPIQQPQDVGSMNNASANSQGMINENMMNSNMNSQNMMNQGMMNQNMGAQNMIGNQVNVQNAQFTPFGAMPNQAYQPENIDLIMDVPLEVTVELGRTKKSISEILDFGPGKIIELNKLAGEPIDILVNGKYVAKGEVVVIEESFGVRITEIVNSKINTGKTK